MNNESMLKILITQLSLARLTLVPSTVCSVSRDYHTHTCHYFDHSLFQTRKSKLTIEMKCHDLKGIQKMFMFM